MDLNNKDKVMLAIYKEYQKDIPNMRAITGNSLNLESDVFDAAIEKLENDYFIKGAKIHRNSNGIYLVVLDRVVPTEKGIYHCENVIMDENKCEFMKLDYVKSKYKVLMDTIENYEASGHAMNSIVANYVQNEGWRKISEVKDDTNILITIKK